jgi:hypothetical protein
MLMHALVGDIVGLTDHASATYDRLSCYQELSKRLRK